MTFKDYFSGHARVYADARPTYPDELYAYLSEITIDHGVAWDCATGNGQTAVSLAPIFDRVIATDGSAKQLESAPSVVNVDYEVALAEQSPLASGSVDLVTVSQALHWFDLPRFFAEVERVLKPGGVLAIWSYGIHSIEPAVDQLVDELYRDTLDGYWTEERRMVEQGYANVVFPFTELITPQISMNVNWTQGQLESYLRSWSATDKYIRANGEDPVTLLSSRLTPVWQVGSKQVNWPLVLFARRKPR